MIGQSGKCDRIIFVLSSLGTIARSWASAATQTGFLQNSDHASGFIVSAANPAFWLLIVSCPIASKGKLSAPIADASVGKGVEYALNHVSVMFSAAWKPIKCFMTCEAVEPMF